MRRGMRERLPRIDRDRYYRLYPVNTPEAFGGRSFAAGQY